MPDPTLSEIMERWKAVPPQARGRNFAVLVSEVERQASEIERLREALTRANDPHAPDCQSQMSQAYDRSCDCGVRAALNEKEPRVHGQGDDVGPPAPGEGDELENPEIGMAC